jgi:hypothetical protein
MIALIASALLGLYVFLPVFIFDKTAAQFVRLKRNERSKTEEIMAGILVAGIPFCFTWFLSQHFYFFSHWPFSMPDPVGVLRNYDYKTVFNGLYSDHYFDNHIDQFWVSFGRAWRHQARFAIWNYGFLTVEIGLISLVTWQFGRFNQWGWFRATVGRFLLNRVSEWEPLFTSFVFHPEDKRRVEVDLITSDGHLYRGTIENHFVGKDGELRGLLLKNTKRFKYAELKANRAAMNERPSEQYWKEIPGSNMYVAYDKTVTLNLRYELSNPDLIKKMKDKVVSVTGISDIEVKLDPPVLKPNERQVLDGT